MYKLWTVTIFFCLISLISVIARPSTDHIIHGADQPPIHQSQIMNLRVGKRLNPVRDDQLCLIGQLTEKERKVVVRSVIDLVRVKKTIFLSEQNVFLNVTESTFGTANKHCNDTTPFSIIHLHFHTPTIPDEDDECSVTEDMVIQLIAEAGPQWARAYLPKPLCSTYNGTCKFTTQQIVKQFRIQVVFISAGLVFAVILFLVSIALLNKILRTKNRQTHDFSANMSQHVGVLSESAVTRPTPKHPMVSSSSSHYHVVKDSYIDSHSDDVVLSTEKGMNHYGP